MQLGHHSAFLFIAALVLDSHKFRPLNRLNLSPCLSSPAEAPGKCYKPEAPARRSAVRNEEFVSLPSNVLRKDNTDADVNRPCPSEARRANGQLRSNNLHGPMHPLLQISGEGKFNQLDPNTQLRQY